MDEKIDFVIIWVDGSDEKWLKKKNSFRPDTAMDASQKRFEDWDLLKYWFRAVEKYAPWVNNIYFVSDDQVPEWMNTSAPKLKVVKHTDFIPKQYLPTFSSHVIELNLHRIKGLSEKFVYFNDDMYIVNNTKPTDFFRRGKPVDIANIAPVMPRQDTLVTSLVRFNNAVEINNNFNARKAFISHPLKWLCPKYGVMVFCTLFNCLYPRTVGYVSDHQPSPFLKHTFREVWEKDKKKLEETCERRFRSKDDVNQYLFKMWQLYSNNFEPKYHKRGIFKSVSSKNDTKDVSKAMFNNVAKTACINDFLDYENKEEDDKIVAEIRGIFERKYPEKCSFEK